MVSWWEICHKGMEESLLGERKPFRVFIENFPTSSFCKKGEKILVLKISVSFGQKNFDSPTDFCQELLKNMSKGFYISISRCFSYSETGVYKFICIFFSTQMLSKCLPHFSYRVFTGFKTFLQDLKHWGTERNVCLIWHENSFIKPGRRSA